MDTILKDNDLVSIGGNRKLFVIKSFTHNNENYAYCQDVTNIKEDNSLFIIAKEIVENDEARLDILTDRDELEKVLPTLRSLIS